MALEFDDFAQATKTLYGKYPGREMLVQAAIAMNFYDNAGTMIQPIGSLLHAKMLLSMCKPWLEQNGYTLNDLGEVMGEIHRLYHSLRMMAGITETVTNTDQAGALLKGFMK